MRNAIEAVREHRDYILSLGYKENDIVGIFLFGSQNYGLEAETSDVDTKCVILPSLQDSIFGEVDWAKELHLPNGEHCNLMTIQHYVNNLLKCNLNYTETLFSDYCILNPLYEDIFSEAFLDMRETIAVSDKTRCVKSVKGQMHRYFKEFSKVTYKILARGVFLKDFVEKYMGIESFENCIKPSEETYSKYMELRNREDSLTNNEDFLTTYHELKYYFDNLEYNKTSSVVLRKYLTEILMESVIEMIRLHEEMR